MAGGGADKKLGIGPGGLGPGVELTAGEGVSGGTTVDVWTTRVWCSSACTRRAGREAAEGGGVARPVCPTCTTCGTAPEGNLGVVSREKYMAPVLTDSASGWSTSIASFDGNAQDLCGGLMGVGRRVAEMWLSGPGSCAIGLSGRTNTGGRVVEEDRR